MENTRLISGIFLILFFIPGLYFSFLDGAVTFKRRTPVSSQCRTVYDPEVPSDLSDITDAFKAMGLSDSDLDTLHKALKIKNNDHAAAIAVLEKYGAETFRKYVEKMAGRRSSLNKSLNLTLRKLKAILDLYKRLGSPVDISSDPSKTFADGDMEFWAKMGNLYLWPFSERTIEGSVRGRGAKKSKTTIDLRFTDGNPESEYKPSPREVLDNLGIEIGVELDRIPPPYSLVMWGSKLGGTKFELGIDSIRELALGGDFMRRLENLFGTNKKAAVQALSMFLGRIVSEEQAAKLLRGGINFADIEGKTDLTPGQKILREQFEAAVAELHPNKNTEDFTKKDLIYYLNSKPGQFFSMYLKDRLGVQNFLKFFKDADELASFIKAQVAQEAENGGPLSVLLDKEEIKKFLGPRFDEVNSLEAIVQARKLSQE